MNQDLVLRVLSEIMNWDTDRASKEFAWLRLMSGIKYDGYQDYLAGARFVESLVDWLQQFSPAQRGTAYEFIRDHLVYIGPAEMQHLVELFYPETVERRLLATVADRMSIPTYRVWGDAMAVQAYTTLLRKTLFFALSDGARIDIFRRANVRSISNEQIVLATEINRRKWDDLLNKLRSGLDDDTAQFAFIFLIDDFVGTGKTFLRKKEKDDAWTGKLMRFWEVAHEVLDSHCERDFVLAVHHYIATHSASLAVGGLYEAARQEMSAIQWFQRVEFSFGTVLPENLPIDHRRFESFMHLVEKYYDPGIETEHTRVGGDDVRLGFGGCALPLVLDHNTPNNSIALLWAESDGGDRHHAMRPLFRRRQRHS
ncbi:MAG: hypothetical protein ACLGJB_08915 [Blastocatellia bacterium]